MSFREKAVKSYQNPRFYLALWALAFSFFAVLLFSTSTSPIYPLNNADFINLDSNFFLYEASLWLKGQTPYLDFFDHKGLYHLAINALALLLGGRYALFVIQILFSFVGVYFLFLAIQLLSGERKSLFLLAGFLYLSLYAMGSSGNVEGEWVLPYVSLSYYYYLKGMRKSSRCSFRLASFFAGIEVGCSLNSRPLDGVWGGVIAVSFFVYALRKKIGWELLYDALFAILGLSLVYALILPFAIQGGYLQAMMEAIFVDSFSYASSSAWNQGRWLNRLLIVLVYALGVLFFLYQEKKGDFDIALFFFLSASIAALLYFIFARFTTYYWSGYTFYILNLVYVVSLLPLIGKAKKISWASPLLYFWACFALVWSISLTSLYYTVGLRNFSYHSSETTAAFVLSIDEKERTKKGNVFALDCDAAIYTIGGITTAEKYLVNQSNWSSFLPEVKEELERYLSSPEKPHYLFVNENDPITLTNFGDIIEKNYTYSRRSDNNIVLYLSK